MHLVTDLEIKPTGFRARRRRTIAGRERPGKTVYIGFYHDGADRSVICVKTQFADVQAFINDYAKIHGTDETYVIEHWELDGPLPEVCATWALMLRLDDLQITPLPAYPKADEWPKDTVVNEGYITAYSKKSFEDALRVAKEKLAEISK